MKLFVYHTPELTPTDTLPDCAVVIDVLRATTTIATALYHGVEAVQAFSNIERLFEVSDQWPGDRRLRAGERGGAKVEGCDLGNSPFDYMNDTVTGKRLFMSTTNGTRSLQRVQDSPVVITAAQINRHAVVKYLAEQRPEVVWIVGSGWEGSYSLEDTVCAGAIAQPLLENHEAIAGNDEVIGATALYQQWQDNLVELFRQSSHGQRLLRLGCDEDLAYCAKTDLLEVLPMQTDKCLLMAAAIGEGLD